MRPLRQALGSTDMKKTSKHYSVFISGYQFGDVTFNFLNRDPINELHIFADGYHRAGKELVEKLLVDSGYGCNYLTFPILFLYRHSLELYFKAIVYTGGRLLGLITSEKIDDKKLLSKHELTIWLPAIKKIFDHMGWEKDFQAIGIDTFDDFKKLIEEIEKIDPGSYSFRYPVTKKGDASLPDEIIFNPIGFGKKMDQVLQFLEGAVFGLKDNLDFKLEDLDEYREYMDL
jgi:hypothetical protein